MHCSLYAGLAYDDCNMLIDSKYQARHCSDIRLQLRYSQRSVCTLVLSVLVVSNIYHNANRLAAERRPDRIVILKLVHNAGT
jgi:hypothetical protein